MPRLVGINNSTFNIIYRFDYNVLFFSYKNKLQTLTLIMIFFLGSIDSMGSQNFNGEDLSKSTTSLEANQYVKISYQDGRTPVDLSSFANKGKPKNGISKPKDSDNNVLTDTEVMVLGTNPNRDTDNDGLNDIEERWWACNPQVYDTDDDGFSDGNETKLKIGDPNKGDGCPYTKDSLERKDNDHDGLPVGAEIFVFRTDPTSPSSDGDRYSDGMEILGFDFYDKAKMPDYVDHDPLSPATADIILEVYPKVQLNLAKKVTKESTTLNNIEKAYNAERGFKEAATLRTKAGYSISHETSLGSPEPTNPLGVKTQTKSEFHFNIDLEAEAGVSASQTWNSKTRDLWESSTIKEIDLSGSTLQTWIDIKNVGNDIASEGIKELMLNIYMGDDKEPFDTYQMKDVIGTNLKPHNKISGITIKDIKIDYDLFNRLMLGEGIRVGIAHYSFGDDQIYLNNAIARCIEIDLDDGTDLIKRRIAPSSPKMTLHEALNRSRISIALENGTIKSINGKEIRTGTPPHMWWTIQIAKQQAEGTTSPNIKDRNQSTDILKADVYPGDLIFLKYQIDSDGDLLPDAEERIIGTSASNTDTDADGLWDGVSILPIGQRGEREFGTNPLLPDTDFDGLNDSVDEQPLDVLINEIPDPVVLFENQNYWGESIEIQNDTPDLANRIDKIQSLKVPWGCAVQLFDEPNYEGKSKIFTDDTPAVGMDFYYASSMKVNRIVLYELKDRNPKGKSKIILNATIPYIGKEFDDNVTSLSVPNGYHVILYENKNYTGKSAIYVDDFNWVGGILHDKVSSIKVFKDPDVYYIFVSKYSKEWPWSQRLVLMAKDGDTKHGEGQLDTWRNAGDKGLWKIIPTEDGWFILKNKAYPDLVLLAINGHKTHGETQLGPMEFAGDRGLWKTTPGEKGTIKLVNKAYYPGFVLYAEDGLSAKKSGGEVQIDYSKGWNRFWKGDFEESASYWILRTA